MQNAELDEARAGWSTSWNQDFREKYKQEISITIDIRYTNDTTRMAESEEELKNLLMRLKKKSEKAGLKLSIQKWRSWHPVQSLRGK